MSKIKRALLVVDVQNEYVTGNMQIAYPPINVSLPNIEKIIEAAVQLSIPVIAVQHDAPKEFPIFAVGSDGWQLHPMMKKQHINKQIHKTQASCFVGTDLEAFLQENGINTLTIIGYMTHNCVASTAIEAAHKGYNVEFISDATGSLPYKNEAGSASAEEIHRIFSVVLQSNFAGVATTDHWLKATGNNELIEHSNVYISHLAALSNE